MNIRPDWTSATTPFDATWSRMMNADQFQWMVRADMLEQLAMVKEDLDVEYIRGCGMFDDKMKAWTQDPRDFRLPGDQRPRYLNFQVIDYVFDRLQALGIRPLYTTSFTPSAMASGSLEIWQHSNTTQPKDLKQWTQFVRDGILHELSHRGLEEVSSWYFECWNEANLSGCFYGGTQAEWFELWAATYEGVKAACPDLRLGGPSTARGEWIEEFLDWTGERGCPPDYLISHFYNNDSEAEPLSPFDGPASHKVKDSPHFGAGVVRGTRKMLDARGFQGEVHWNEWGRSWFPADPAKETPLEAAYVAKTMCEVSQEADIFAFWCISDIYDQAGYGREEFQGNYGMLSLHGLRKPAYFAHMLLNQAAGERVELAEVDPEGLEGAVATRKGDQLSVLAYRYPAQVTDEVNSKEICISLPAGTDQIRVARIDRKHHNIKPLWDEMGAPAILRVSEAEELRAQNQLEFEHRGFQVEHKADETLIRLTLENPGVLLLHAEQ